MRSVVSLCVTLLAVSAFGAATAPYIESFDVRVNSVDVVVTDAHGNRVTGLSQRDFQVLENGVAQPITNFSEYRNESGVAAAVSRKFVFVVDDMSLHPQTRQVLKESVDRLLASALREGDEAMIVTPQGTNRVALPFTSDRALLRESLDAVIDGNYFRAVTPLERDLHARAVEGAEDPSTIFMTSWRAAVTLGNLQSIVSAMAEVPGKKTMILITEWLPAVPTANESLDARSDVMTAQWSLRRRDLRPRLDAIARTASTNGISIYCLQPEYGLSLAVGGPDIDNHSTARVSFPHFLRDTEASMEILAGTTGASWSHQTAKLFSNLQEDLSTYYSIGYRPTSTVEGKTRRIDVRVKGRADLRVRTRRDVVQKSTTEEMNERVVGHLIYPKDVDELGVTTHVGTPRREDGTMLVPVTVAIPIANLTLLPDANTYRASFSVHYAAAGRGEFSSAVQREQVVEIPASTIAKARGNEYTYTTDLRVRPGKVDIAIGVLDPISRLTSFKTLSVDAQ